MKLIIQIPCLNEEAQLPDTLADLPRHVPGFDVVEWMIIDDGSSDRTIEVARTHGVDHVVKLPQNRGLAHAFQAGLDAALKLGADVIVNTDADNQYDAAAIPLLVAPILDNRADLVVGDRDVRNHPEFSKLKIRLQVMGSWVVQKASSTTVPDATSGFRAYSAEAAIQLIVVNRYTYTLESLIQAGKMHAAVASVPVGTNAKTRESRLFGSMWGYMRRNAVVITRVFAAYEPLRFFGAIALLLFFGAAMAFVPFFYDWLVNGESDGHLQSIVLGAILALAGVQMLAVAFLADLIASNRMLTQRTLERVRRLELAAGVAPSHYLEIDLSDTDSAPAEGRSGEAPRSGAGSPARSAARDA
ncbi:MAG: glycosyltransferase family 2 protein [Acidimicrobiales bacterium]